MRYLVGSVTLDGKLHWQDTSGLGEQRRPDGLTIHFPFYSRLSRAEVENSIANTLRANSIHWLSRVRDGWLFDGDAFKRDMSDYASEDWLKGPVPVQPDVSSKRRKVFDREEDVSHCQFDVTPEMVSWYMPKRIFLSHKGSDKPMVRRFSDALRAIGLDPWLDDDAMHAGIELERALSAGFRESCAAVFFITPSYVDENFLATEVNYAVREKREKRERFSIITLRFASSAEVPAAVPDLLSPYVWKQPDSDLGALIEIVRALPIRVGDLGWK